MDNRNIDGHVAVGRDVAVGGNVAVQGDMAVGHGLNVRGWLDAPNIKGANKGVFSTEAKLKAAYPTPHEGWYAGVIDSTDVVLYIVDGGEWTSTSAEYKGAYDAPGKADMVSGGTEDNFAALDAEGNLKDSGHKHSDYATKVSGGTSGNLASLGSDGNIADSGKKAADFATATQGAKADTAYQKSVDGIPKSDLASSVQSSLDKADTALQSHQDISGKADKVGSATNDNFAALDAEGNLKDSGHKHSDYATATQGAKADTVYSRLTTLDAAVATAQGAKQDAQSAKNDAVSAKNDAQAAQTAAETAQGAAETAARNAVAASGLAIGEAVRCTYTFASGGKKTLCASEGLQLMVVNGRGMNGNTYELEEAGSVTASFVFANPVEIPQKSFQGITELNSVHIPSFIHGIGKNAFSGCSGITDIDCEAMTPPTVGTDAFSGVDTNTVQPKVHGVVSSTYARWGGFTTIDTY